METPLRLLLIEDSVNDAEILLRFIEKSGFVLQARRVDSLQSLEEALHCQDWDIMLADYTMPHLEVSQALGLVQKLQKDIPFIVVSGTIDEQVAAALMKLGVRDYFSKDNLARLLPAIQREMQESRIRHEHRQFEQKLRHQSLHDSLTDLPNRALFNERLILALTHATHHQKKLAVFFIDLDHFKGVNDALGHEAGDLLLKDVSRRMSRCLSSADLLARLGGDEFLLLSEIRAADDATRIAERLLDVLKRPFIYGGMEILATASLGISIFPDHGDDSHMLLRCADSALYEAKQRGRNAFRLYDHAMASEAMRRQILQHSLRRAVQRDELVAYYQPWLDVRSGHVSGIEAQLRWKIPGLRAITPQTFIEALREDVPLLNSVEDRMWNFACAQTRQWQDAGCPPVPIGLRLSNRAGRLGDAAKRLASVLESTSLAPRCVDLSLCSAAVVEDRAGTLKTLGDLRAMGVHVSLDDFGLGPVRLLDLKDCQFDAIKIHPSLIQEVPQRKDVVAVVSSAIALAHRFGMQAMAKGVETLEQLNCLKNLGCDKAQGMLMGEPLPADHFEAMLRSGGSPS